MTNDRNTESWTQAVSLESEQPRNGQPANRDMRRPILIAGLRGHRARSGQVCLIFWTNANFAEHPPFVRFPPLG